MKYNNLQKIEKNKTHFIKIQREKGFAILFSVVISSIILAITLSVTDISLREIKFSTEAQHTNDAFFAADTGAECALFNDKATSNSFVQGGSGTVICLGGPISLSGTYPILSFTLLGLGSEGKGCARITVDKSNPSITTIISKGYNNSGTVGTCTQGVNSVERELQLTY